MKGKISEAKEDHAPARLKLIHSGKVLKDTCTIAEAGIAETDFIVCMVTKEAAKPKPAAAPTPAPAPTAAVSTPAAAPAATPQAPVQAPAPIVTATPAPVPAATSAASTPLAAAAPNPEVVANLVAMGFPEAECKAALSAAMGNADLAVEFLMGGIPPEAMAAAQQMANPPAVAPAPAATGLDAFRSHPQFNQLKTLVQQNPAAITQVMDAIGRQNPALLTAIHENHDAFVAMMNEPIVDTPAAAAPAPAPPAAPVGMGAGMPGAGAGGPNPAQIMQMLAVLPPEQRAALAQQMNMSPEQLNGIMQMMASMPPEQLQQMTAAMGGMGGGMGGAGAGADAGNVVRLTEEEMASVNRLMELGFSQQQAAQAFLACDRNEALAANLLLEGGWADGGDDMDMEGGGYGDDY